MLMHRLPWTAHSLVALPPPPQRRLVQAPSRRHTVTAVAAAAPWQHPSSTLLCPPATSPPACNNALLSPFACAEHSCWQPKPAPNATEHATWRPRSMPSCTRWAHTPSQCPPPLLTTLPPSSCHTQAHAALSRANEAARWSHALAARAQAVAPAAFRQAEAEAGREDSGASAAHGCCDRAVHAFLANPALEELRGKALQQQSLHLERLQEELISCRAQLDAASEARGDTVAAAQLEARAAQEEVRALNNTVARQQALLRAADRSVKESSAQVMDKAPNLPTFAHTSPPSSRLRLRLLRQGSTMNVQPRCMLSSARPAMNIQRLTSLPPLPVPASRL